MHGPLLVGCLAASALAGCAAAPTVADAGPDGVQGRATFFEKLMMPRDSRLAVELLDLDSGATVASETFVGLPGPPYAFRLRYDPAAAGADARLGVRATLSDPRGERMFATPEPVPVEAGTTRPEEFRMLRTP